MADISNQTINECIMRFARRAERVDRDKLVATFVSSGPLFTILSTPDHQILYGRRGTGKTHALQYLADDVASKGDIAIYIDMRTVGSDGSIYNDETQLISERATRLLVDVLGCIQEELLSVSVERSDIFDLSQIGPLLDQLADAISKVRVIGPVAIESTNEQESAQEHAATFSLRAMPATPSASVNLSAGTRTARTAATRRSQEGRERFTIHFGTVGRTLTRLAECFQQRRFWLLLDEWSAIPLDLQPYLADLLRRAVFPVDRISVKLAAIEHRSSFQHHLDDADYIGIEVGADAQANLN